MPWKQAFRAGVDDTCIRRPTTLFQLIICPSRKKFAKAYIHYSSRVTRAIVLRLSEAGTLPTILPTSRGLLRRQASVQPVNPLVYSRNLGLANNQEEETVAVPCEAPS